MVVFEIRDDGIVKDRLLGYLFYYERSKRFFAELLDEYDEWAAPFIFSGFVAKGQYSIGSEWSKKFVEQRIVPPDRQNLGAILKDNGLKEYDEYRLLLLSNGRCAQDEIHLRKISEEAIESGIRLRLSRKVKECFPLAERRLLVFFRDGKSVISDVNKKLTEDRLFLNIYRDDDAFKNVRVAPGGNGIEWGEERNIPAEFLYDTGKRADIQYEDMVGFIDKRLVDTTDACRLLGCSRQYIDQLMREGKLTPVRATSNNKLFMKSDIESELSL